jgi:hypothetical protein
MIIYIDNLVLELCFFSITSFYAQIHINLSRIFKERKEKETKVKIEKTKRPKSKTRRKGWQFKK